MIGAGYYREVKYLEFNSTTTIPTTTIKENISKDLLNQVAFSIATTDMLIRFQSFKDGNYSYTKDRAGFLNKK